jgi:SAM-dependent methyltransferase
MVRIGVSPESFPTREVREKFFEEAGRGAYECIRSAVPHQDGQTILDFGCGSGRVLRWFAAEPGVHLTGCDVYAPSIAWMHGSFDPAIKLYVNDAMPPLPEINDRFDLICCSSVFSHLTQWAPWVLELRRVLRPGGILVASIHGRGFWGMGLHGSRGVPWDEDNTGLLVEQYGTRFEDSWGPAVYVSEWWVRAHWGRAFEIECFRPTGFALPDNTANGQAWLVARKPQNPIPLAPTDLESPSDDPRETTSALRAQRLAYEEVETLLLGQGERTQGLEAKMADLARRLAVVENSKSWALTRPLRMIAHKLRTAREH